jgi:hypothetical protein
VPQDRIPLVPMLIALAGYLVLQLVLNLLSALYLRGKEPEARNVLKATFWAGVVNALYFTTAAVLLHILRAAPNRPPHHNYGLLALLGVPIGPVLWYATAWGRKIGLALFGRGELVAGEDAVLRVPPSDRYIGWGIVNLAVLQPLGRELFLRGAFLPTVALTFGWGWAVAATLIVELLLRMNIVWVFQTLIYALIMCGLFISTGTALTGLVAAGVSGAIQGLVLFKLGGGRLRLE